MKMNNFEALSSSARALAEWISRRLCCDACPMQDECKQGDKCVELIYKWLKMGEEDGCL